MFYSSLNKANGLFHNIKLGSAELISDHRQSIADVLPQSNDGDENLKNSYNSPKSGMTEYKSCEYLCTRI